MKNSRQRHTETTAIEGQLERITFFNEKTRYTIARLKPANLGTGITLVGYLAGVSPGENISAEGTWETHPQYGQQFRVQSFEVTLPAEVDGIRRYLNSGMIEGIGPSLATRLVKAFGADTLEVIEKTPERLIEVEGIGKAKAEMVESAWKQHHTVRRLVQFLQEMGVATSWFAKIYKKYGPDAVSEIQENPYVLADDFPGAGFLVADTIASKLGIDKEEPERVRACVLHIIFQNTDDGHTFAEEQNLFSRCENLFNVSRSAIQNAADELAASGAIVVEAIVDDAPTNAFYIKDLHRAEAGLANRIEAMLSVPTEPVAMDAERLALEVHQKLAINLSTEQLQVLEEVLSHRIVIITGGPGTGKTTLLRSICTVFETQHKRVQLAAPTGRAARRMTEVTGRKAGTIHRILGYNFAEDGFIRNRDNPLDAEAVIVDEASMVDTFLMYHLLTAMPVSAALVLVGDVFQLPSVGPGNVLSDMIGSGRIPVFYLNKIFRQKRESAIVINAHKVRQGECPVFMNTTEWNETSNFHFIEQSDPEQVAARIVRLCTEELPGKFDFDPVRDIQVLTPMHKGAIGTINLNHRLQKVLNPQTAWFETPSSTFKMGDKVMHLRNNYQKDVYNGDIGVICSIDRRKEKLEVKYDDRTVGYESDELDQITMAYAISVHKSQGSEYPAVIMPILTQHYVMLQRNLLYTAMTRGKKMVVLIGTPKALHIALKNNKPQRRLSSLANRL